MTITSWGLTTSQRDLYTTRLEVIWQSECKKITHRVTRDEVISCSSWKVEARSNQQIVKW